MLIKVRCKNVLGLICNFLSMYSEMFQVHLLTAIHLLQRRYRESSLGFFSSWFSKLVMHVHNPDH